MMPMTTTRRLVTLDKAAGVATLTLNRPEKLNALTHGTADSTDAHLIEALDAANADPEVGCIVLTGAGRAFSVGGDMAAGRAPR